MFRGIVSYWQSRLEAGDERLGQPETIDHGGPQQRRSQTALRSASNSIQWTLSVLIELYGF